MKKSQYMNMLLKKVAPLAAYILMVTVNYLAVALPIAGRKTGEVSDSYPNLFAPAGYTFSIWALIYTLLAVYVIYQLTVKETRLLSRINLIFIPNAILNAAWLFAWHYELIWLSVLIMGGLVTTLGIMAETLRTTTLTKKERWLVRLPFNVYFGWITVAAIANIIVFTVSLDWYGAGLSESAWTVIALLSGAFIGSWRMLRDRAIPYGSVLIWAYGGILYKHLSEKGFAGQYQLVMFIAGSCMLFFACLLLKIGVRSEDKSVPG